MVRIDGLRFFLVVGGVLIVYMLYHFLTTKKMECKKCHKKVAKCSTCYLCSYTECEQCMKKMSTRLMECEECDAPVCKDGRSIRQCFKEHISTGCSTYQQKEVDVIDEGNTEEDEDFDEDVDKENETEEMDVSSEELVEVDEENMVYSSDKKYLMIHSNAFTEFFDDRMKRIEQQDKKGFIPLCYDPCGNLLLKKKDEVKEDGV
mgnify:CR=1 FL=1